MSYDPLKDETRYPAISEQQCDNMARKYQWAQPDNPGDRYEATGNDQLPVMCVFEGDCEFPLSPMDYSQGDFSQEDE